MDFGLELLDILYFMLDHSIKCTTVPLLFCKSYVCLNQLTKYKLFIYLIWITSSMRNWLDNKMKWKRNKPSVFTFWLMVCMQSAVSSFSILLEKEFIEISWFWSLMCEGCRCGDGCGVTSWRRVGPDIIKIRGIFNYTHWLASSHWQKPRGKSVKNWKENCD